MSTPMSFLTHSRKNSVSRLTRSMLPVCLIAGLACLPQTSSAQDSQRTERAAVPTPKQLGMELGFPVPTTNFMLGCIHCQKGQKTEASRHIENAVKVMVQQSKRATKKGRAVLEESIDELQTLSDRLKSGAEVSTKQLKRGFARAHHALAYHHHELASEAWARRKFKDAGEEMKAAVYYTQSGASWLGHKVEKKTENTFRATFDVGKKLARGAKQDAKYVEGRSKILGSQIHEFGRQLIASDKKRAVKRQ